MSIHCPPDISPLKAHTWRNISYLRNPLGSVIPWRLFINNYFAKFYELQLLVSILGFYQTQHKLFKHTNTTYKLQKQKLDSITDLYLDIVLPN